MGLSQGGDVLPRQDTVSLGRLKVPIGGFLSPIVEILRRSFAIAVKLTRRGCRGGGAPALGWGLVPQFG